MENIVDGSTQSQENFDVDLSTLENLQVGEQQADSPDSNVHTKNDESQDDIEIDERFRDLDPAEARIRTLKSRYDKTTAEYNKLMKNYDERDQVAGLLDQMIEDEGLLTAFISEVKPELIKSRNAAEELKTQLKKEFGDDFKPTLTREEADRDDPFGKDAQYYSRIDELKVKLKADNSVPTTVKEYLKRKRDKEADEARKYETERENVKTQYKMSDDELKAVSDWALKLKFADLVKVHRFLRKFPTRNPNITDVPGGGVVAKSDKQKWLDEIMPVRNR